MQLLLCVLINRIRYPLRIPRTPSWYGSIGDFSSLGYARMGEPRAKTDTFRHGEVRKHPFRALCLGFFGADLSP